MKEGEISDRMRDTRRFGLRRCMDYHTFDSLGVRKMNVFIFSTSLADVSRLASSALADNKSRLPLSCSFADVAQLVERVTRNDKVAGSIPAIGSKKKNRTPCGFSFCGFYISNRQSKTSAHLLLENGSRNTGCPGSRVHSQPEAYTLSAA